MRKGETRKGRENLNLKRRVKVSEDATFQGEGGGKGVKVKGIQKVPVSNYG